MRTNRVWDNNNHEYMKHLEEEKREVYDIYTVFLFVIYFKEEKNHMKILRTSLFVCCLWPSLHRCKIKKKTKSTKSWKIIRNWWCQLSFIPACIQIYDFSLKIQVVKKKKLRFLALENKCTVYFVKIESWSKVWILQEPY